MIISSETLNVLKNFASINPNVVISPGQKLKTISEAKTILSSADIVEDFPVEFGVYDLNEFLAVYNLIDSPELEFEDKSVLIKNSAGSKQRVRYYYSQPEILTTPQKDIQMPEAEVGVNMSEDILAQIRKAAAVLGHTEMSIKGEDGVVTASVIDVKDATSNSFLIELDRDNACKSDFNFVVSIPNLKLLPGDYFVSISSKLISNWTNANYPVEYFIALEKSSTYGV